MSRRVLGRVEEELAVRESSRLLKQEGTISHSSSCLGGRGRGDELDIFVIDEEGTFLSGVVDQEAVKDMTACILEIGIIERRMMSKRRLGRGRRGQNKVNKRAISQQEKYPILYFNKYDSTRPLPSQGERLQRHAEEIEYHVGASGQQGRLTNMGISAANECEAWQVVFCASPLAFVPPYSRQQSLSLRFRTMNRKTHVNIAVKDV